MASPSSAAAPVLASPSRPPPTPTSLLDLPQPWLLQLAKCSAIDKQSATLVALLRTCTLFRDAVLRHRTAFASFSVPIAPEDFSAEVERLCTVARRSSRVKLRFEGTEWGEDLDRPAPWTHTEPQVTHLLVCAMAELGGERPLACVKEIRLNAMEQTSLVPAWVKVLCPNATKLDLGWGTLADPPLRQPLPHPHLQQLRWERQSDLYDDPPLEEHVRQQLSALPSLTSLALRDLRWADDEEEEGGQPSSSRSNVTRLELQALSNVRWVRRQFPRLRELALNTVVVDDEDLEELLECLPHLERLSVNGFRLQRSHAHAACPWRELTTHSLHVDWFAHLPLDDIPACGGWAWVRPSSDAAAVARVAQAVERWGGRGAGVAGAWWIEGEDFAALLTTLGPLAAALPAAQQRRVVISSLRDVTSDQVQQLGQHLPASITTLTLTASSMSPDAWPALLPSLPAGVEEVHAWLMMLTEEQVLAVCQAAVRPVRVVVSKTVLSEAQLQRVRSMVAGAGLVALEERDA